ncbi:MAG TPA: DNA repair protein [Ruminococcaceae bacterium]|nr:DNA repair protein [Oscillospiraceae bacterium]
MTEKELKKLSRSELLEMLIEQTRRNEELNTRVAELEEKLENYDCTFKESGTLAEAFLKLGGIFEAADKIAADYVEAIKKKENTINNQ